MLQFIVGSSGAGKSYMAYHRMIKESMQHPEKNYLVLVPEQFTLQTQKELVTLHPNKGIMNIDVLSFLRLAYRVFSEVGTNPGLVLEDMGKSLIVKKVLMEKKGELEQFAGTVNHQGFIGEMKSVLSEFFQYGIDEEQLEKMKTAAEGRPSLERKLKDIETVYCGFREFLSKKYITAEEIYDLLSREVEKSKLLRGAVVVLDGFTGFTPSQYQLLEALMKYSESVSVTVTMDPAVLLKRQKEHQLFFLSKKTMDILTRLADHVHCELLAPVTVPEQTSVCPRRFIGRPALQTLEKYIFRYPQNPYTEETEEIRICSAVNPAKEVFYAVCEMNRLIHEGVRYRDIAVITGDIETYGVLLRREFDRAELPGFIDCKRNILTNPLVELLRSLLELADGRFTYEQVFRWCKCGLSELTHEETDLLENYVLAFGIRGKKRWDTEWTAVRHSAYPIQLEKLNELRIRVTESLFPVLFILSDRESNVAERIKAIREYLEHFQISDRIGQMADRLRTEEDDCACANKMNLSEQRENALLIKEYEQINRLTDEIFERAEELLGDEILSVREFREILETGFDEAKVGLIPPGTDQIVVGDIERTRLRGIRFLFFLGVNDGIVPAATGGGGILSDEDRSFFMEHGIELSPTRRQHAYTAEFYLYMNLTKPCDRLYVSFSANDSQGKRQRPSFLIGRLCALFPKLTIIPAESIHAPEYLLGTDGGRSALIDTMREFREGAEVSERLTLLLELHTMGEIPINELAKAVFYRSAEQRISEKNAERIYGRILPGSVTRMEKYASCALAHFLTYGLRLEERKEYKLTMPDIGSVFHEALELFSKKLVSLGESWKTVDIIKQRTLASECVKQAAADYGNGILESTKRNEYLVNRVERILQRTLLTIREQLSYGSFEPERFEQDFTYASRYLSLRGRIDRIDACESNGKYYVRVIDYKSGDAGFDLNKLYHGLQLQLGVYLGAALSMFREVYPESNVFPAGLFYYRLKDPIVEKSEHAEEDLKKMLRLNGLVNQSPEVIRMQDIRFRPQGETETAGLAPSIVSDSIPVETKADGTFSAASTVTDGERLEELTTYLYGLMDEFGRQILNGEAQANPCRYAGRTSCDFCSYRQLCSYGELSGKQCRNIEKLPAEEIWGEIGRTNNKK